MWSGKGGERGTQRARYYSPASASAAAGDPSEYAFRLYLLGHTRHISPVSHTLSRVSLVPHITSHTHYYTRTRSRSAVLHACTTECGVLRAGNITRASALARARLQKRRPYYDRKTRSRGGCGTDGAKGGERQNTQFSRFNVSRCNCFSGMTSALLTFRDRQRRISRKKAGGGREGGRDARVARGTRMNGGDIVT